MQSTALHCQGKTPTERTMTTMARHGLQAARMRGCGCLNEHVGSVIATEQTCAP